MVRNSDPTVSNAPAANHRRAPLRESAAAPTKLAVVTAATTGIVGANTLFLACCCRTQAACGSFFSAYAASPRPKKRPAMAPELTTASTATAEFKASVCFIQNLQGSGCRGEATHTGITPNATCNHQLVITTLLSQLCHHHDLSQRMRLNSFREGYVAAKQVCNQSKHSIALRATDPFRRGICGLSPGQAPPITNASFLKGSGATTSQTTYHGGRRFPRPALKGPKLHTAKPCGSDILDTNGPAKRWIFRSPAPAIRT